MNAETLHALRPAWWADASCAGRLEDFYGNGTRTLQLRDELRALCAACPVFAECREETDAAKGNCGKQDAHGFRAGETARERVRRWQREAACQS